MITSQQLQAIFPTTPPAKIAEVVGPLNSVVTKYFFNSNKVAIAAFIAQCGHESGGFSRFSENLNYSAAGLVKTFRKYFDAALAARYARNPEAIANRVYANRMGNGNERSGDGWRFRGRGAIQITGRANYELFAEAFGLSLDEAVVWASTAEGAIESAGWFFAVNNLIPIAEAGNLKLLTKRINGGYNGLADRQAKFDKALSVLG